MGQTILVGVGGGIAAYKMATVCSMLVKQGFDVHVLMTEHATRFIQPLTFQALTHHEVVVDTFAEPNPAEIAHIALADKASLYLIAPATANLLAKLAIGIADDMVTTTALAVTAPLIVAPAMNVHMYSHPTVQQNLQTLRLRGVITLDPGSGPLACGYTGKGRLPEPEDIVEVIQAVLSQNRLLQGKTVVVTAGPTVEDIDPVRFLSNASTGKMGYAIAEAAVAMGARVVLISGPTHLSPVAGCDMVNVRSTENMLEAVLRHVDEADVLISAAAPADFRPSERSGHKWKKTQGTPSLTLVPTPDILSAVSERRSNHQVIVGFAAETDKPLEYGRQKLMKKKLDLVVVNDVSQPGAGFAVDTNVVTLVGKDGTEEALPLLTKAEVAKLILTRAAELFRRDELHGQPQDGLS